MNLKNQMQLDQWDNMKSKLAEIFKTKTRDEWDEIFEGSDVCYSPKFSLSKRQLIINT